MMTLAHDSGFTGSWQKILHNLIIYPISFNWHSVSLLPHFFLELFLKYQNGCIDFFSRMILIKNKVILSCLFQYFFMYLLHHFLT